MALLVGSASTSAAALGAAAQLRGRLGAVARIYARGSRPQPPLGRPPSRSAPVAAAAPPTAPQLRLRTTAAGQPRPQPARSPAPASPAGCYPLTALPPRAFPTRLLSSTSALAAAAAASGGSTSTGRRSRAGASSAAALAAAVAAAAGLGFAADHLQRNGAPVAAEGLAEPGAADDSSNPDPPANHNNGSAHNNNNNNNNGGDDAAIEEMRREDDKDWQRVIDRAVPAVVALHVNSVRPFDTEKPGASQATGFVVDRQRGLILTNRHVVHHGPVVGEAIFANHEEVPVRALYRDPVHDFGFFQFDPAAVKHMQLEELPLAPENARVGTEIRLLGNNAGEKLSILSGTLARLDRHAPNTGIGHDFNTYYIQAASGTSGGSSGSPVIDKTGAAVALNAAGKMMTTVSYYLPLDRVKRALELIRRGEPVTRGTLQTKFMHTTFGELSRLGMTEEQETAIRKQLPDATGLLTARDIVVDGPAFGHLEPGDVLLRINGKTIANFVDMEDILDNSVGADVELEILRGAQTLKLTVRVQDLHSITPSAYFEAGGCVFTDLGYHQALAHGLAVGGVYVSKAGYMLQRAGVAAGTVITHLNGEPTPDVETFARVMASLHDRELVPIRVYNVRHRRQEATTLMPVDRTWFPMQFSHRDDKTGLWPATTLPDSPSTAAPEQKPASTSFYAGSNKVEKLMSASLAVVRFIMPYTIDSLPGASGQYVGTGLVVDADKGLVLVDRNTVPCALGDATITFADSIEVPAKVVFVHPIHNIAVVQYDKALVGKTPVKSAKFAKKAPEHGQDAWLVGLAGTKRSGSYLCSSRSPIGNESQTSSRNTLSMNMDALTLQGVNPNSKQDGVVVNPDGEVLAFWASFGGAGPPFLGVPAEIILDTVQPLQKGKRPTVRALGVRLEYVSLAQARGMGLDDKTAKDLEDFATLRGGRRQAVVVGQRWGSTPAASVLEDGDMLLEIDGTPIASCREVDVAIKNKERVTVTVQRNGQRHKLEVETIDATEGRAVGTDRIALWAGAVLQSPPPLITWLWHSSPVGVYISSVQFGSPAQRFRLSPTAIVQEVDGHSTPDLDAFLHAVAGKKSGDSVRIKYRTLRGKVGLPGISTLKLDNEYWPTATIQLGEDGTWERVLAEEPPKDSPSENNNNNNGGGGSGAASA